MHFVMLPSQALCDANGPPFLFPQQFQGIALCVHVVRGYQFEHVLWKLHVSVLELIITIPTIGTNISTGV